MRLFNQFLWRNVAQRAVQRLVDACERVNQDIVRDHEGALRSLRLLQIESEVQTVQVVQFVGSSRFGSTPILPFPHRGERYQTRCSDMLPLSFCVIARKLMNRKASIRYFQVSRILENVETNPGWPAVICLLPPQPMSRSRWSFTHGVGYHGLGDPFYEFGGHGHEHEARVEIGP